MRLLITGGTGVVGWALLDRLGSAHEVWYTSLNSDNSHPTAERRALDVRDVQATTQLVRTLDPDVVVHAAAMTDVDACETDPELAHAVNVTGTRTVVNAAADVSANVVFFSTSFVFDGSKNPYAVQSERTPLNEYGRTKAAAERVVEDVSVDSAIVRTDQPYDWTECWQTPSMVEWTLSQLDNCHSVEIFEDWHNTPTYLSDLVEVIAQIATDGLTGTYHAVGPGYLSRYNWGRKIAETFGYDREKIVATTSNTADLPAPRPNVRLDNESVTEGLEAMMCDVTEGLRRMRGEE